MGLALYKCSAPAHHSNQKRLLIAGIGVNLALLGYFKYANFFVETVNGLLATNFNLNQVILPLAISFFTFQQIAYLVDVYRDTAKKYSFFDYSLFVGFFPQLIAGPIVHHDQLIPQFNNPKVSQFNARNMAIGLTIFCLGLGKKVLIADSISVYATPVFEMASQGTSTTFVAAWIAAFAYSLQLYFDFSGYSDMAIGIARMFNIKLPLNFYSPYKAKNISDFWRRWHITLSGFLRDYLYIPLGGSRMGIVRRNINLMVTMLLGGLWHGAGWTFVFWGGLHGAYLVIHRQWQSLLNSLGYKPQNQGWSTQLLSRSITFLAVVVGWVFFRADSMRAAISILKGMVGANGLSLPYVLADQLAFLQSWSVTFEGLVPEIAISFPPFITIFMAAFAIIWFAPNIYQWMEQYTPAADLASLTTTNTNKPIRPMNRWFQWRPIQLFSLLVGVLAFMTVKTLLEAPQSEFLYFNF
ncbi:MBOAT family protein [Acaryochloris sp. IP29b_bin.148]|uniref:MBOAT family O-acyltransferase n=1 Tax=Acaryochloris sp. IP29b_bin.148 TaxID=2969218 RepID=UPI00262D95D0|nr:MBOAT family protein [Acaryochloris sp. IP29b_bin.148]